MTKIFMKNFGNLNENHEMFSNEKKKFLGKFKTETPENIWIDEFVCLRAKASSFKCGKKKENKLKGISKSYSKNNKFDEYKKCFDGRDYQKECDNYITRSLNHEIFLQRRKNQHYLYPMINDTL